MNKEHGLNHEGWDNFLPEHQFAREDAARFARKLIDIENLVVEYDRKYDRKKRHPKKDFTDEIDFNAYVKKYATGEYAMHLDCRLDNIIDDRGGGSVATIETGLYPPSKSDLELWGFKNDEEDFVWDDSEYTWLDSISNEVVRNRHWISLSTHTDEQTREEVTHLMCNRDELDDGSGGIDIDCGTTYAFDENGRFSKTIFLPSLIEDDRPLAFGHQMDGYMAHAHFADMTPGDFELVDAVLSSIERRIHEELEKLPK